MVKYEYKDTYIPNFIKFQNTDGLVLGSLLAMYVIIVTIVISFTLNPWMDQSTEF